MRNLEPIPVAIIFWEKLGKSMLSDSGQGHGPPPEDAGGQETLRPAQTHPGTGLRHHQVRAGTPPIPAARTRQGSRRVEPRDHGLEPEADVCPEPGAMRPG